MAKKTITWTTHRAAVFKYLIAHSYWKNITKHFSRNIEVCLAPLQLRVLVDQPVCSFWTTVLLHYSPVTLQSCHTTVLSQYSTVTLQSCHSTVLSHYSPVTLQNCHITVLSHYSPVTLQYSHTTVLSHYNTAHGDTALLTGLFTVSCLIMKWHQ
jgi:hypothetical protein